MNKFIFTSDPESQQMAFNEIKKYIDKSYLLSYITPGVGLVETPFIFSEVSEIFKKQNVIFIRHIAPVNITFDIKKDEDILSNLESIKDFFINKIEKSSTFSIQTRIYTKNKCEYNKSVINQLLSDKIIKHNYVLDVKKPDSIVSILINDVSILVGISNPLENLSYWPGGEHRFKKDDTLISRAEFKLLEAIEMFNLDIKKYSTALDLGASPGGWTKVLLDNGLKVTCVDPANLSKTLEKNNRVTHHKCLAQDFLENDYEFDIIVNDMRMDIYESIALMKSASRYLVKDNSIAIMTLKLREKNIQSQVNKALVALTSHYKILYAKQLFHNRSEVTVVLAPLT